MLGRWKRRFRKIRKQFHKTYEYYLKYSKEPIDEHLILLEAGQGKNINGNMFAILRELCTEPRWSHLKAVFVVTKDSGENAEKRFAFYGYQPTLVVRNSEEYCRLLATAKYLLTDNSFPPYFNKREGQIYLNTWHGTPLKTLGKSEIQNVKSMANLQKNYLMSDYALFPNEFTRDVFMKDYMLENIYKGKVVLCDYPRNGILLDEGKAQELRKKLGLEQQQLIAYMPTWRGSNRMAEIKVQKKILQEYFEEIDAKLREDQIFYVNLHFLVGNEMNFDEFRHIRPFPAEYETYDFLALCDMLVTDYSSVFFDFAPNGKKIILFAYDLEEYMRDRGTYFSMESLPFPLTRQVDELIAEINSAESVTDRKAFLETYCAYCERNASRKVLELLTEEKTDGITVENAPNNGKELLFVYGGKLNNRFLNRCIREKIKRLDAEDKYNLVLGISGNFLPQTVHMIEKLPGRVNFLNIVSEYNFPFLQKVMAAAALRSVLLSCIFDGFLKKFYERERKRLFYGLGPAKVINMSGNPAYMYKILAGFQCEKEMHIHHDNFMGFMNHSGIFRVMMSWLPGKYDRIKDHRKEDVYRFWKAEERETYYNKCLQIGNLKTSFKNGEQEMTMRAVARVRTLLPFPLSGLCIQVHDRIYHPHMRKGIRWGKYRITAYSLKIPYAEIPAFEINNKVTMTAQDDRGAGLSVGVRYHAKNKKGNRWARGPIKFLPESNTSAYFRQSLRNWTYFTVRTSNMSDTKEGQAKIMLAYWLAKFLPDRKKIILFEKNSARYEESASVLYEKLIDMGYKKIYFILDREYPFYDAISEKYRRHLVAKGTLRHYIYFFQAKKFIGTETISHAIELRVEHKYAKEKLASKDISYVFLQHGVMYMVSLDSESRTFFKPNTDCKKYRVVTSSREEARHFTELGGYDPEFLYICGLPKYDRNYMSPTADKIVIMPTWRPWEYNGARFDFSQTKYYQMTRRIFDAIPEKLRDRVVILPHPLFYDSVKNAEFDLKKYMDSESKYDDILKETKVLITDYSSISYDAFYRGANVIFYWEEKEECLANYGESTKLMLNEDNIFGDICRNSQELEAVMESNYSGGQKERYRSNYRKIVEFHDGKNTERLVELLKKDDIL